MRSAAALALAASLLAGCGADPASLLLRVQLPDALAADQLRVRATDLDGKVVIDPLLLPEQPASAGISGDETLRLLLPDALDGTTVRILVEALQRREVVGRGEGACVVELGAEVELLVAVSRGSR